MPMTALLNVINCVFTNVEMWLTFYQQVIKNSSENKAKQAPIHDNYYAFTKRVSDH